MKKETARKWINGSLVIVGLSLICYGAWGFDHRIAYILGGIGLFLMGLGVI